MPKHWLIFQKDDETGLPRLRDLESRAGAIALQKWEEALMHDYEKLVEDDTEKEYEFEAAPAELSLPKRYRVTVQRARGKRCPELLFEPVEPAPAVPPAVLGCLANEAGPPAAWQRGFVAELEDIFGDDTDRDPADQAGLRFVLRELHDLAEGRPIELTLLLMAGYLTVAERACLEHDLERCGLYVLAARALDRAHGRARSGLTRHGPPDGMNRGPFATTHQRLRWSSRCLRWLLHIGEMS